MSSSNDSPPPQSSSGEGSSASSSATRALSGVNAALPPLSLVVKMKGLPFRASTEDIVRFFGAGFSLKSESIYLRRHSDGRPCGEAFVQFDTAEEARRATQKDRETFSSERFGERYVRVYPSLESDALDMQQAVQQQQTMASQQSNGHSHADSVVKIKSLPFDANQLDIIQFFANFKLKPNGVQLVVRADNKPTGEAFVDFENAEEAGRAIRERDHKVFSEKFGDRYVRLIQVSRKEMQATLALRFGGEGILKMKGIPFKAGAADVRKFFSAYKIKPDGVSFIMHADGRPTGMAFIEFETPQEAVRAMEKDRAKFGPEYGDRFCMLQLVGRHEMDKVQLQREGDIGPKALLAGMNGMNAAAAIAAALQGQNLSLVMGQTPWLNGLNHAQLNQAALAQFGLINGAPLGAAPGLPGGVNGLAPPNPAGLAGALPQLPVAAPSPVPPVPTNPGTPMLDAALAAQLSNSLPTLDPTVTANNMLLYGQHAVAAAAAAAAANGDWAGRPDSRTLAAAGALGMGSWTPDQLAVAAAARQTRGAYTNGGSL